MIIAPTHRYYLLWSTNYLSHTHLQLFHIHLSTLLLSCHALCPREHREVVIIILVIFLSILLFSSFLLLSMSLSVANFGLILVLSLSLVSPCSSRLILWYDFGCIGNTVRFLCCFQAFFCFRACAAAGAVVSATNEAAESVALGTIKFSSGLDSLCPVSPSLCPP